MLKLIKFKKLEFLRQQIIQVEKKKCILKYINLELLKKIKLNNVLTMQLILKYLYNIFIIKYILKYDYKTLTRYKRFCFISKHNRTFRYFRLSRMCLKEFISKGNILGIYKSSW